MYPPYHDGQNRIIEFVKALKALPRHEVYAYTGNLSGDPDDPCPKMTLWPIEAGWEGI